MKIEHIDLIEKANENVEEMKKNIDALELVVSLLQTNFQKTLKENEELKEENAIYRKQLYDVDFTKY